MCNWITIYHWNANGNNFSPKHSNEFEKEKTDITFNKHWIKDFDMHEDPMMRFVAIALKIINLLSDEKNLSDL